MGSLEGSRHVFKYTKTDWIFHSRMFREMVVRIVGNLTGSGFDIGGGKHLFSQI